MKLQMKPWGAGIVAAASILCVVLAVGEEPANKSGNGEKPTTAAEQAKEEPRVSVATARDRAQTLHKVYASTLEALHHHYFHGERAIVPARAMEDVFEEIAEQSKVQARWISVNTKPMSVGHEPKSDFEKKAAKEIAGGKEAFESIEDGVYRRAGAIPLSSACVTCHTGFFAGTSQTPRFAGLVISIPVNEEQGK